MNVRVHVYVSLFVCVDSRIDCFHARYCSSTIHITVFSVISDSQTHLRHICRVHSFDYKEVTIQYDADKEYMVSVGGSDTTRFHRVILLFYSSFGVMFPETRL